MYSTTTTNSQPLSIASIVVFVVLVQPATYCLWRHGKRGFIGWFSLQTLCIIRIAGNALTLHAYHTHSTGGNSIMILQSIGLAPLLLGSVGILHEARRARNLNLSQKFEWSLVIQYHILVSAVLALLVVGIVKIGDGDAGGTILVKIGIAFILLCWAILVAWTLISTRSHQSNVTPEEYADGTKLLYGVVIGLPFILLRELFTAGSYFAPSSKFTTSVALKVCMSVVPEMLITTIFVLMGISTRNISVANKREER